MSGNNLCFNGVNGATGGYLLEPMSATQVVSIALGETIDSRQRKDLRRWTDIQTEHNFEAVAGIDPCKLEETGWGVIFAHNADPAIREALSPLLDLRKTQASIKDGAWYKEFKGAEGYRYGESNRDFLARHGVEASQPADPARGVPYYLLIVGSPEDIPFRFQYLLDVQYAVGRIWFETLDEYSQYARSVVAAETGKAVVGRKATFFGVQNADDPATFLSSTEMVKPLAVRMPARLAERESPAWDVSSFLGALATKDQLSKTLQGKDVPSLLFTASHGMGFPNGDPRQLAHQGALLCQDWPGPRAWNRAIPESHYFSADDVPRDANLQGLIAFHFACYGAGTPELDDFAHNNPRLPRQIAPKPFIAKLPRKLLAQGALAVVGHVERAWGYSFYWNRIGSQLQTFESTLYEVMEGKPIGRALEFFNTRYAALATELSTEIEEINKYGKQLDEQLLAGSWTAHNDARSYVILGDPAVRLPLSKPGQSVVRPEITRAIPGGFEIGPPGRSPQITQVAHVSSVMSATDETPSELLDQIQATEHRILAEPPTRVAFDVSSRGSAFRSANDPARLESRMRDLGFSDAMIERFVRSDLSFGHVETVIPIDELNPDDRILERILGRNDMVDAPRFLLRGASAAQATGRVRLLTASGGLRGWGTGSLIAPRLLLTNNHVLGSISHAESALLEFNVQDGTDGKPMKQVDFQLKPSEFFITDKNLDFTLVAVAEKSTDGKLLKEFGFNPGSLDDDPILVAESVNIVQHPSGRPKQIALRENTVTRMLTDFIHYQADTEPGSSGSPVFNDQWDLVALHHSGVPRRDSQGNILARDGSIWKPAMGDNQIDWIANEGVRISRILNFVRRFKLTGAKALQLHKELFEKFVKSSKKKISGSPEISPVVSSTVTPEGSTSSLSSTVSIPLTLNITLDIKGASGPIVASVSSSPSGATTPAIVQQDEAISIDPDYDSREGYDPDFLGVGALRVDRPKLSATQIKDAARLNDPSPGADRYELKYHHYSVVMNRKRRLAFYTAVNIDGKKAREIKRETDKWFFDSRIPKEQQIGEELYSSNPFDRGHLVRRLDPAWGNSVRLVKIANDDTFHFTNCSPQHEKFNQGKNLWQGVENFLLSRAMDSNQKLTVFTGPVFRAKDPDYRGVQIPLEYWKVAVLVGEDGKLTSVAFLVTQADLIESVVEEGAIDVARMFQTSVRDIERLTGLNFGRLRNFDSQSVDSFSEDESQLASSRIPIESLDRIRIVGLSSSTGSSVEFGTPPSASTGSSNPTHGQAKQTVIGTDLSYYLLSYDANSKERQDHPGCLVSQRIFDALDSEPITDVFLFSHGWRGDVPAAREQYQGWLKAMASCEADRAKIRKKRPGFRPLLIGLHWPSEPWGDESLSELPESTSFAPVIGMESTNESVEEYASRLGDSPQIREALRVIFDADRLGISPDVLPEEVLAAYKTLGSQVELSKGGLGAAPGADWNGFDPEAIYEVTRQDAQVTESVSFGLPGRGTLLAPLRVLSFWKMKDLARHVGEHAVHSLLSSMQSLTEHRDVRYHLAGHSFGCIVASAAIAGPPTGTPSLRPVDSLSLLQGALSVWSYCDAIPTSSAQPGYFHRIVRDRLVRGSIMTTQSRFDTAVGKWYPRATWIAGQLEFSAPEVPLYGAVGAYGIRGSGLEPLNLPMKTVDTDYPFAVGRIYNLDGSNFINQGGGISGAHSDIQKPQVAHAVWNNVMGS